MSENDFTPGQKSITGPGFHLTMSSFGIEDMKRGDIYQCTHSAQHERIGKQFEVKKLIDKQMLEHLMAYGDRFDRIKRGGKSNAS